MSVKARDVSQNIGRKYGSARAQRFAARLRWKSGAGRRARKKADRDRARNARFAKGHRCRG